MCVNCIFINCCIIYHIFIISSRIWSKSNTFLDIPVKVVAKMDEQVKFSLCFFICFIFIEK